LKTRNEDFDEQKRTRIKQKIQSEKGEKEK
jgi:hypothetical protein